MKRRRYHSKTIPIAPIVGLAASFLVPGEGGNSIINLAMGGNWNAVGQSLSERYLGWDIKNGNFNFNALRAGLTPILAGIVVHKIASATGINRALRSVPYVRL